jgi:predicted MPP superfamily phosphohydrolase
MFFMIVLTVMVGANFYVFWRLWHIVPQGNPVRWVVLAFGVAAVSSIFIARLFDNSMSEGLIGLMDKFGTSWFFFTIYFLMLFVAADILRLCGIPLGRYMFGSWTGFFVSAGVITAVMVAGNICYYHKKRVELNLTVEKPLPASGLKIVALSDLHLGYTIGRKELNKWIELVNAEHPDIVLIAGDITDKRAHKLIEDGIAPEFRKIKSKYGVYASLGNHEYINNVDESISFLHEAGITVLRDSAVVVDSLFYVVGRDDRHNRRRQPLDSLMTGLDRRLPVILLDHQPYNLEQAEQNGVDLQISGHTHRGQVWPVSWRVDAMYEKSYGYLRKGDAHIYVSSGIGIWGGKYRIGTRSEYVVITLASNVNN